MFDDDGFLIDLGLWNDGLAAEIALQENIVLEAAHWEIIHAIRAYYDAFGLSPAMRPFTKYLKQTLGADKASSIYLLKLFPESPAKLAAKIAGLPKPDNCL